MISIQTREPNRSGNRALTSPCPTGLEPALFSRSTNPALLKPVSCIRKFHRVLSALVRNWGEKSCLFDHVVNCEDFSNAITGCGREVSQPQACKCFPTSVLLFTESRIYIMDFYIRNGTAGVLELPFFTYRSKSTADGMNGSSARCAVTNSM